MPRCLFLCFLFSLLCACGGGSSSSTNQQQPPNPVTQVNIVTTLGAGPHLGFIVGFDELTSNNYDQVARVAELTSDSISAGVNISRFQVDWAEFETAPGVYDTNAMNEFITQITDDPLPAYVTLSSLDSGEFTFPAYLMDGDDLANNLTVASAQVTEAFQNFLDWFVPQLTEAGVWGLSIGNEGDSLVRDGVVDADDFITFFRAGLDRVNALDSNMSASVTFTGGGYSQSPEATLPLLGDSDHVTLNFYCLDDSLQVTDENTWADYMDSLKMDVGSKAIFFQELGCPVGYGDDGVGAPPRAASGMGGSPSIQTEFVDYMFNVFISDPQFIGATWFQLLDWSPELAESYTAPITAESMIAGARTEEWLATSGLCRWADGTCRIAWQNWLDGLSAASAERDNRE